MQATGAAGLPAAPGRSQDNLKDSTRPHHEGRAYPFPAGLERRPHAGRLFNEFMFSASRTVTTNFSGDYTRKYTDELGLPNPNNQPGYPVVNNIGVGKEPDLLVLQL